MRKQTIIAMMMFVAMFVVASNVMPRIFTDITSSTKTREQERADSIATVDSLNRALDALLQQDSLDGKPYTPAPVVHQIDTTQMDSLQLAIYHHNKAIDDSLALDSINRRKKNGIDAPVVYEGNDSMVYFAHTKTAHIYGDAKVDYENMKLNSEVIHLSLDSSLVRAEGVVDTTGEKIGTPIFNMGNDKYESEQMAFNFKTKKGLIKNVYTEQEDGFMTSALSKRDSTGAVYMQHGRYTTCDAEHPDFYIALTRAKVRPGKDVIFGPAYLVVADVPLPLAIPYGFFPFTQKYSSGFIMPTYGDETSRGFYLRDGGYYFALNDMMDLKLIGEIYTKGSWGVTATTNYKKRYKYSGSFLASYQNTINGEKDLPDYSKASSFKITWNHRQEQTTSPQRFSATVNFSTSSYEKNNLQSMYNPISYSENTRTSSISWSTSFASLGLSINLSSSINQVMKDSTLAMTLPDVTFDFARWQPFKRKKAVGGERWYEQIYLKYSAHISNSLTSKENQFLQKNLMKDWSHTISHSLSGGTSFSLLNYINITPTFSFNDNMYLSRLNKRWDETTMSEKTDTTSCFGNVYNWNLSLGFSTSLYGFYVPSRKLFGDKIIAIRHVFKPDVSFSYAPNFSTSRYGFYDSYSYTDSNGALQNVSYCKYAGASVSNQMTGSVTFGVSNNIEMKVKSDKDSTGFKKLSIIDNLGLRMSYNFAATTHPLSDLNIDLHLKWFKNWDFNTSATFYTYAYEVYDDNGTEKVRVSDRTEYSFGRFGRYGGIDHSFSYTLTPDKIKKWFHPELRDKDKDKNKSDDDDDDDVSDDPNADPDAVKAQRGAKKTNAGKAETDSDGYMAFSMPWSLSFNYSIGLHEDQTGTFNKKTMRYPFKFSQRLSVNGNLRLSDGWNISFSSGYDFDYHKISMTTASLSRDLHCFNMSCSVTLGTYTSYNFCFRCNASTLTDALKYDKQSSYSNSVQWY